MADHRISCHVSATELVTEPAGWRPYGASGDLTDRERREFAEVLPFARPLQGVPDCPWLGGVGPSEVLHPKNYARLRFAFGEEWGRLAFSIWGRIGEDGRSEPPWRVMTLTLLFDQGSFRMVSGNPEGLLARIWAQDGRRVISPSRWFSRVSRKLLREVGVFDPPPLSPGSTASLEQDRLERLGWMADRLAPAAGDRTVLCERLGMAYRALSEVLRESSFEFVALPDPGKGYHGLFARFVWLSLPLADREKVSFHGEVGSADQVRSHLSVLPSGLLPEATPANWVLFDPEILPDSRSVPESFQAYARSVCGIGEPLDLMAEELALRDASLFEGDAFNLRFQERPLQRPVPEGPTLSEAFDEVALEGTSGRKASKARVAALGARLAQGARSELGALTPEEASGRLLEPFPRVDAPLELKSSCASALLEQLAADEDPWGGELAARLATGWMLAPSGPNILGWFSHAVATRPECFEPLARRLETALPLLNATGTATQASAVNLSEAKAGVISLLLGAPSPLPESLVSGIETPRDGPELRWALGILDRAVGRVPRELVLRKFLDTSLGTQVAGAAEILAGEFRLLSFAVEHASLYELEALFQKVDPSFQKLWRSFDARMWGLEGAESGESWARLLSVAGWDLGTPSPTEFEASGFLPWVLAAEAWSGRDQKAFEVLAGWMAASLQAPAAFEPIAKWVVESRCSTRRVLHPGELKLVAWSVRLLGAAGSLDEATGSQLARASVNSPGAPLIWADAWQKAGEGGGHGSLGVFAGFSTAAATQVSKQKVTGEALDEALMVGWLEYSATGTHTFVETVLAGRDPNTQKRIVELLERKPPPALYKAIRKRAQALGPFAGLNELEARNMRTRLTMVAPALSPLFGAPGRRRPFQPWERLGWWRGKRSAH